MTALAAPIVFNNDTGSDSLSSGSGPATAVNSTTESTTASFSGATITFSGDTDLLGVSTGDLLYLITTTGRKFSIIATVNDGADSLTTDASDWAGTTSGLNWAIGGKRDDPFSSTSRDFFENGGATGDAQDDYEFDIEETGTNYQVDSGLNFRGMGAETTNPVIIRCPSVTRATINLNRTGIGFIAAFRIGAGSTFIKFENFIFDHTGSSSELAYFFEIANGPDTSFHLKNCDLDTSNAASVEFASAIALTVNANNVHMTVEDCYFTNWRLCVLATTGSEQYSSVTVLNCFMENGEGTDQPYIHCSRTKLVMRGCILKDAGENGVTAVMDTSFGHGVDIQNNTIFSSVGDGIEVNAEAMAGGVIANNICKDNGGIGINISSGGNTGVIDGNCLHNNSVSNRAGYTAGDNEIEVDPEFVDSGAANDFSLAATSPCKAAGLPVPGATIGAGKSGTTSFVDIGAAQRQEPASGAPFFVRRSSSLLTR